jgi:hypothetical protein
MGLVSLPYTITNPIIATAAMFNGNFDAIKAQVNGNLEEVNISELAQLTGATVTATEIKTEELDPTSTLVIKLPSSDGSHAFRVKDHLGQARLEIKSDGTVTIF